MAFVWWRCRSGRGISFWSRRDEGPVEARVEFYAEKADCVVRLVSSAKLYFAQAMGTLRQQRTREVRVYHQGHYNFEHELSCTNKTAVDRVRKLGNSTNHIADGCDQARDAP